MSFELRPLTFLYQCNPVHPKGYMGFLPTNFRELHLVNIALYFFLQFSKEPMALSPTLTHDLFYTCHIKQFTAKQIVWYFFALPLLTTGAGIQRLFSTGASITLPTSLVVLFLLLYCIIS